MKTFVSAIFISTLLILGVFAFAEETSALTCPGVQTCTTSVSIPGACAGSQNQQNCINSGGTCSGSTCNFTSCSTSGSWTCSDTTSGSCTYSGGTCDETGDVTTTYYSCGSSAGSCASSSSTEFGACNRNTNGTSCGTNQVCSGGSCISSCVSSQGQACNINACGQAGGTIQCDGSCSGSTPSLPANYGNLCTSSQNTCGSISTGSIGCNGACSASTPSNPSSCTKCNNVGECNSGYECSGSGTCSATAPADKTLSVTTTASPSSGPAPLKNVQISASVGGTATGTITYKLDCTNDLVYDATETSGSASYTFTKKCDYNTVGTYTVRVNVTRQTLGTSDTETVSVASVSLQADPSASTVAAKTSVTYTATSGFDVGPTPYYIRILEGTIQIATCSTGTTCSSDPISDTNRTRTFIAEIQDSSGNTIAASNSITTTWQAAVACAAPQNLSCTYNGEVVSLTQNKDTLSLSWNAITGVTSYFMEWARFDKPYGDKTDITGATSGTVGGSPGDTTKLTAGKTYKLHVRADAVSGSACSVPGTFSADIECYTGTCKKNSTPRTDSFTIPVQTSNGTKNCSITATHSGRDLKDSSSVFYQETACQADPATSSSNIQDVACQANTTTNSSTIAMDDNPSDVGCQDNLVFTNVFGIPSTGVLNIIGEANSKRAGNDLAFGYRFTTSECVITGVQANTAWNVENAADNSYIGGPIIETDKKTASLQQAVYADTSTVKKISDFNFTLKECTQDSHCSSVTNKTYCNGGETRNISASILPQNTCIDSVKPTSKIKGVEGISSSEEPGFTPGTSGAYSAFLRADNNGYTKKTWRIYVEDTDIGDSGLETCYISVNDVTKPARACNGWTSFTVGRPETGADCTAEQDNTCRIKVWAQDRAGNANNLNIARLIDKTTNEKNYKSYDFNEFTFGVDWTPPTAQ